MAPASSDAPAPEPVAEAFGLPRPNGPLVPVGGALSTTTWRLDTAAGRFLVKRVQPDDREWLSEQARRSLAFELAAIEAGVAMPRPLEPSTPAFGFWTEMDGHGFVRVCEWVDGRPLRPDDDVAGWIGRTLATLNTIQPSGRPDDEAYGLHPLDEWRSWFEEARALGMDWAAVGMRNLDGIAAASAFVREALDGVDDFVVTHRDPEPWNILITSVGPVLLDFDWVGEESAWLVAAWAAISYAMLERSEPDADRTRAVVDAYVAHGGRVVCVGAPALARRVALRLIRLSFNIWIALGHRTATATDREDRIRRVHEKLPSFPSLLHEVEGWSRLLV